MMDAVMMDGACTKEEITWQDMLSINSWAQVRG
jgi:hypothetical protein